MNNLQKKGSHLKKIIKQTETKFGRDSSANWRNKDFEDLSFEINQLTKILISPATLKRIFGKVKISTDYSPQESTIKALEEYSGYVPERTSSSKKIGWLKYSAALLVPIVFFLFWLFLQKENNENIGDCKLVLLKVEGNGPASAYFNYSVPESKDSIFLNFGDGSGWLHITGEDQTVSHFYGYPDYFNTEIRTREKVLTEQVRVFVPTTGWKALAHYFNPELIERYFPVPFKGNVLDGIFHATRNSLASLGIDSTEIIVIRLDNFQKTNVPGDNFILKSRFKNSSFWPAIRCFSVYYTVQGTTGKVLIKFVGKGCSNVSELVIGEKSAYGSGTDLSCFTVDLHQWSDIEIRNTNKLVSVAIGDSVVFENQYEQSIGEILGSTIMFHGSGSVDYIYLKDEHDNPIFQGNLELGFE